MKGDRQKPTDKEGRGKEKEQKAESCMMQTCDNKLQKRGKAAASSAEYLGAVQRMHLCIPTCRALLHAANQGIPAERTQPQPSMCHGVQVLPQHFPLLRAPKGAGVSGLRAPASVHTHCGAPSHHWHRLKGRLAKSTTTASPPNSLKAFILQGKEEVKRQTTERNCLNHT